jgi:predicted metal-dependent hydrolase
VHELLHLRISNHGRVFKALMSAHVPGWRAHDNRRLGREAEYIGLGGGRR